MYVSLPLVCWCGITYFLCFLELATLGWSFVSSVFCGDGFVDRYCLKFFFFSWNILFSISVVIECAAGSSSLG